MKKFTTTLLLAIGLLVGFTVNAQAVNAATLNMSYSDYWYDRAKADGSEHHSWHFTLYDMDGEVAYCIQPNVKEGTHYNQGSWEDTGLSNSIKERILLIGYYGYTYPGHQTLQYRAATQGMIWDTIVGGGANTTFHTARWAKGDTFDVSNEKVRKYQELKVPYEYMIELSRKGITPRKLLQYKRYGNIIDILEELSPLVEPEIEDQYEYWEEEDSSQTEELEDKEYDSFQESPESYKERTKKNR